jgi:ferrous iron transport protein B
MTASTKPLVALIGNPNCGKTTLFNQLTGLSKKTGNWSGVTVDSQYCAINYNELEYNLVDLPGIYALSIESQGQDESHVHDFLQNQKPDVIINILNAVSLERGLFLTLELIDLGHPVITVLNMWDEAQQKKPNIDVEQLSKQLKGPVLTMVARTGQGVEELKKLLNVQLKQEQKNRIDNKQVVTFDERLKQTKQISNLVELTIAEDQSKKKNNNKLDTITTHPVWGMVSFVLAMYVMFFFAINVSAVFIDFFDLATGALLISGGHQLFDYIGLPEWLSVILADGVGGGVQTVATFIPVIGFLFLVLTWLEDSGYMARAAFVMNGLMQKIGLSGQAFVPLIVSFGCNVPAIAATRSLPSKRERLVTIMMAPFMSCGARLSVYALFVAAFFNQYATFIVLGLYFTGILVAILTGLMLQKTILPGKAEPFLMELPPWRRPTLKNLMIGTWRRLKGFILDAGKIIIIMVMLIQVLNSVGKDLTWGNQDSEKSVLSAVAKSAVPIFRPMGIEEKNWPAIVGILTGVLAKEVVVGTLDALYTSLDKESQESTEEESIGQQLTQAVVSIKDNALGLTDLLLDPLGLSITEIGSDEKMAEKQDVNASLFGIIRDRFSDKYAVFAYLLFILLYFPCVAATAAISREASVKWAVFSGTWSTGLAYLVAVNFYQLSHFSRNPVAACIWLGVFIASISAVYFYLKKVGKAKEALRLKII